MLFTYESHLPDSIGHSPCQRRLSMAIWMTRLDRKSLEDAHTCACDPIELLCKMQQHRWPCCSSSAVDSQEWQCHPPSIVTILSRPRPEEPKIYRGQRWMMPYRDVVERVPCIWLFWICLIKVKNLLKVYVCTVWTKVTFIVHWFYSSSLLHCFDCFSLLPTRKWIKRFTVSLLVLELNMVLAFGNLALGSSIRYWRKK